MAKQVLQAQPVRLLQGPGGCLPDQPFNPSTDPSCIPKGDLEYQEEEERQPQKGREGLSCPSCQFPIPKKAASRSLTSPQEVVPICTVFRDKWPQAVCAWPGKGSAPGSHPEQGHQECSTLCSSVVILSAEAAAGCPWLGTCSSKALSGHTSHCSQPPFPMNRGQDAGAGAVSYTTRQAQVCGETHCIGESMSGL